MASPPSNYNLSKKRPSLSGTLPANPSKRRKPSTGPSGLRQTSFPPESSEQRAEFSRSPSVDSSFTANTNTTRRKGKKGKGDDDVRSTTGTSVRGGKAAGSEAADKDAEEEEDDEGGEALDAVMEGQGEADEKQEAEHLRMLIDHLDPDQSDRYAKYRAVKLKKEIVRRITNQTLSQSVPQSVVTTINSYTKVFIGSLIERARTVQEEWQAASEYAPINDPRYAVLKQAQQPPAPPQQHSAPPTPHPQAPPPTAPSAPQTSGGFHNPYGYSHLHQQPYNPGATPHQYSNVRLPGQPNSASSTPPTPGPVSSYIPQPSSPAPPPTGSGAATPTGPRAHTPNPAASQPSNVPNQPQPANANGTQSTSVTTSIDSTVSSSTDTAAKPANANNNPNPNPTNTNTNDTALPSSSSPSSPPPSDPAFPKIPPDAPLRGRLSEWDRGPLTPDHLREALRRYKRDREGGAMGFLGLSLEGRERTAGRMGGRRLFR